jgi:hypothetical protein
VGGTQLGCRRKAGRLAAFHTMKKKVLFGFECFVKKK